MYIGTPVSDLCKEERWKHEENPLDIWDKLLAHAREDKAPAPDDIFRFKFHGLFYVAPAQDSFMLRLRMPGTYPLRNQMRGFAEIAEDWGSAAATSRRAAISRSVSFSRRTLSACSRRCSVSA